MKRLPGWYGDKRIPAELSDGIGDILGWRSERTAPSPHLGLAAIPDGHAQEGRSFLSSCAGGASELISQWFCVGAL